MALTATPRVAQGNPETQLFFSLLTQDDHSSWYVLARSRGSLWTEIAVRAGEVIDPGELADGSSWYITHNGFASASRRAEAARQVNALFFDIDCHGGEHERVVPAIVDAMKSAVRTGLLPCPTMIVDSGRGVHLYYVLEKATPCRIKSGVPNAKGLAYFNDVQRGLSRRLEAVVAGVPGAEVDRCVYDISRVARVPGSYNKSAGRWCELVECSSVLYTLPELQEYTDPKPRSQEFQPQKTPRAGGGLVLFDRMLFSRLGKLQDLQAYRGYSCTGHRDNMLFVFYNTATQIYGPERAFELARAYNAKFSCPLPDEDLDQIKRTVDGNVVMYGQHAGEIGFYPLSAKSLVEKLSLTADEVRDLHFFASKKMEDRIAAKQRTKARRDERDRKIVEAYAAGGVTQAEVAKAIGCSLRTVSSVLSRNRCQPRPSCASEAPVAEPHAAAPEISEIEGAAGLHAEMYAKNCPTSCCVEGGVVLEGGFGAFPLVRPVSTSVVCECFPADFPVIDARSSPLLLSGSV